MTIIVPNNQKLNLANIFNEDIGANAYYFFIGDSQTSADPIDIFDYDRDISVDCYHNMIMGQKIDSNSSVLAVRNIPYVANTVYTPFDDSDKFISEKDFYVVVNETANFHVYKCLDNNFNNPSTTAPTFSDINGANTEFYTTSDGYTWKYMYSVTDAQQQKFGTTSLFPVIANTTVIASAVPGAIDFIDVEVPGRGYDNYLYDTFSGADIRINGNSFVYAISNTQASSVNSFYTGCMIYLSEGSGQGQNRTIVDYFTSNSGKYIVIDTPFDIVPQNGTVFQVTPRVIIRGSGDETVPAIGRALVNAFSSNSINRIEMLVRGQNYSYLSANVYASPSVPVTQIAQLRPIYSPAKGHGHDPAAELYAHSVMINSKFNSNTITINTNSFSQIGIIKNPTFALATIGHTVPNTAAYLIGETVRKIEPSQINVSGNLSVNSATLTCATANFTNQVVIGDYLYLESNTATQLGVVNSIINATAITLTTNGYFTSSNTTIYKANPSVSGIIDYVSNTSSMNLRSLGVGLKTNDTLIGTVSGTVSNVTSIMINGVTKNFDTFIALYKYDCTAISGTFIQDERVTVGTANGYLHSALANGANLTLYVADQIGPFQVGNVVTGSQSAATCSINNRYLPEIVFGSGDVMYLENIEPKFRSNSDVETFKTVFEF